jgi:6-phosphogluconolactonase/glucosamine-6-phosphate isomerase/deaminase
VIKLARSIFLFARGEEKWGILATALENPNNIDSIPGRLAIDSTLIVDTNAAARLNKK